MVGFARAAGPDHGPKERSAVKPKSPVQKSGPKVQSKCPVQKFGPQSSAPKRTKKGLSKFIRQSLGVWQGCEAYSLITAEAFTCSYQFWLTVAFWAQPSNCE